LAVRRAKGSHIYDVIPAAMDTVHKEFGIYSKVITDNRKNFLKVIKENYDFP
jgi:hypothetical protein